MVILRKTGANCVMIMKKTFIYILAAVAAFAAVSCNKAETEIASEPMTITATFEGESRTTPNSDSGTTYALWSTGDQITVFDETEASATFTLSAGAGTTRGTFTQVSGATLNTDGTLYAIYGGTNLDFNGSVISFDIPTQDGSFAKANICTAESTTGVFSFSPATAIVKVIGNAKLHHFSISAGEKECYSMGTRHTSKEKWGDVSSSITSLTGTYYIALFTGSYSFIAENYVSDGGKGNPKVAVNSWNPTNDKSIVTGKIYSVSPSFDK